MQSQRSRVTMTDVARAAGVSPMTVSYTYNRPQRVSDETRAKVLETAASLGYPGPDPSARSLRYGATRTLGLVLGEHLTYAFDDPQAVQFLAGIAEVCAERGFGLLIVPTADGDPERVTAAAVDAYVVWTTTADDPVLAAARATRRRVVVHGEDVGVDNRAAARAVGAEVFAGARRPAVLSFPIDRNRETFVRSGLDPDEVAYPVTRDRLAGYRDAAGPRWAEIPVGVCRTNDEAEARAVMRELGPDVDAVAAMSDRLALAARREGVRRVSGWDDSEVAQGHGFTTVAQSLRAQGSACALAALGSPAPDHHDSWHLVRRGSTASDLGE